MEYGITENGFVLKRFDTILGEMQEEVGDTLGFDVAQNPQSMLNSAILYPMADRFAELWELAQESYFAKYPSSASGLNLDNACQYGSIRREPNSRTEYVIHCTGTDGTVIGSGKKIATTGINPQKMLYCVNDSEITRDYCNSLKISVVTVATGDYWIKCNGTTYTYTAITGDDEDDILNGLKNAFILSGYTKTIVGGLLIIANEDASNSSIFDLSTNLSTGSVTSLIHFNTVDYGDIEVPNGRITTIVDNITGLSSVTNLLEPIAGRLAETDYELRQSYIKKSFRNASTTTASMKSFLLDNVQGIRSANVYENYTDAYSVDISTNVVGGTVSVDNVLFMSVVEDTGTYTFTYNGTSWTLSGTTVSLVDYGITFTGTPASGNTIIALTNRPPHSIEAVVDGGQSTDVAECILAQKPAGIASWGTESIQILTDSGDTVIIRFSRPESVFIWMKVTITAVGNVPVDYVDIVKQSIYDESQKLTIGDDVLYQTFINNIYDEISSATFCKIETFGSTNASATPSYSESNVVIKERQVSKFAFSRITVIRA